MQVLRVYGCIANSDQVFNDMYGVLGGYVAKFPTQWARDPFYCLWTVWWGYFWGDGLAMRAQGATKSLLADPNRFKWNQLCDH